MDSNWGWGCGPFRLCLWESCIQSSDGWGCDRKWNSRRATWRTGRVALFGAAWRSGAGPLPWLWGRKWCLKGEVGRESLFLEPTLLLQREEQSFCMPVKASAGRRGVRQGGTEPTGSRRQAWMNQGGEEVEGKRNIYRDQMSRNKTLKVRYKVKSGEIRSSFGLWQQSEVVWLWACRKCFVFFFIFSKQLYTGRKSTTRQPKAKAHLNSLQAHQWGRKQNPKLRSLWLASFQTTSTTYLAGENAAGIATRWECNHAGYKQVILWSPGWWSAGGCVPFGHRSPNQMKKKNHSRLQKRPVWLV